MKPCTQSSIRHWEDHPCLLPFSSYTAAKQKYTTQLGAIRSQCVKQVIRATNHVLKIIPATYYIQQHMTNQNCVGHASTLPLAQCITCNETLPIPLLSNTACTLNVLNMPLDHY